MMARWSSPFIVTTCACRIGCLMGESLTQFPMGDARQRADARGPAQRSQPDSAGRSLALAMGGVHGLELLHRDSGDDGDRDTIIETLAAFVRSNVPPAGRS